MTDSREQLFLQFAETHTSGNVLDGQVTKVVPFGAFVKVADGIEGLLVGERPDVGSGVRVKILEIDRGRLRMSLALA